MNRDVAVAIGVGDAKPLPYLSGAVNGARAFHDWASKLGYQSTLLVDDDNQPVTILRLRAELEKLLAASANPIHRLILYFAGHGLIREAEEGLWLLSDWRTELRAVAVEVLKRRLYMHNIQQIAIFSDSCRSLPPDVEAADLTPDAVLGSGPSRPNMAPPIDKFIAAQDGSATFMIPGDTPDQDRCLFSGLLIEGLWGIRKEAFSTVQPGRITSRSLGTFLQSAVPALAKTYNRKLFPNVSPTFPDGDDFYFGVGAPPTAPKFPEWPKPETLAAMGPHLQREEFVEEIFLDDDSLSVASSLLTRIRSQPRPTHFETGTGLAVEGGSVKNLWTPPNVFAEREEPTGWWRVGDRTQPMLLKSAPVLIEFNDGMFAAITALPHFVASVLRDEKGISSLIYRKVYDPADTATAAEEAIAAMEAGNLRANTATDLAVKLRQDKHSDPMLGVISAYLYDSLGDIDSIRRMAYFYVYHSQPIPYDIALLAELKTEPRGEHLWADVPAVSDRDPRSRAEEQHPWTFQPTPATSGEVGGLWPWMRQGWTYLEDPSEVESSMIISGLTGLIKDLKPGRFAMLNAAGGSIMSELFNLSKQGNWQVIH